MNIKAILFGEGRLNRQQFVTIFILLILSEYGVGGIIDKFFLLNEGGYPSNYGAVLNVILFFITAFLFTSVVIRRGHDIGIKNWVSILLCLYLFFIPMLGLITIPFIAFTLGMMMSGPESGEALDFLLPLVYGSFIFSAIFYVYCIIISFMKGKDGQNIYGNKPRNLGKLSEILKFWITNNY